MTSVPLGPAGSAAAVGGGRPTLAETAGSGVGAGGAGRFSSDTPPAAATRTAAAMPRIVRVPLPFGGAETRVGTSAPVGARSGGVGDVIGRFQVASPIVGMSAPA